MLNTLCLLICATGATEVEHVVTPSLVVFFDILEINELQSLCVIGNC